MASPITTWCIASDGLGPASPTRPTRSAATATGPCTLLPLFAGLTSASTPFTAVCSVDLTWDNATSECGGQIEFSVYRSTDGEFEPSVANRIADGLTGNAFFDINSLISGETY